ncbi:cyclase [Anaerocolumna cellulosilytica]|uniref:Cyclase n=1 Tax=Anaerocolumna cellulosilytica TaxID=433286 RepID=A0A6S6R1K1_9FIRM|nr:cyclase family protein [Anaerocolumna cellulosilytica]MBB5195311.1 arylformamidase [Anaerocolumna cellulosilytica]BCJ96784.1 cyclase [Anaerocolumna cellulosilytica]
MKLYDITQEVFSSKVYPGDEKPSFEKQCSISEGSLYNLTVFRMCAHNGTHLDAPYHFIEKGKSMEELALEKCFGYCTVVHFESQPDLTLVEGILKICEKKLLLKGNITVTLEMARLFNKFSLDLIGVEGLSVGPVDAPMEVHLELLEQEVVLLEGICLAEVPEGRYLLSALPLKLAGSDGSPCRAILAELD